MSNDQSPDRRSRIVQAPAGYVTAAATVAAVIHSGEPLFVATFVASIALLGGVRLALGLQLGEE